MTPSTPDLTVYTDLAVGAAAASRVPYSDRREAVVAIRSDGSWIPGVRVESATYSLTISPLVNAVSTAVALGIDDVTAVVASRPFSPSETTYADTAPLLAGLEPAGPSLLGTLPASARPGQRVSPLLTMPAPATRTGQRSAVLPGALTPEEAFSEARLLAERAHVPESGFPVACLLEVEDAGYVPGVNVEHSDWMYVLCAERNALGTAVSYGWTTTALYLVCRMERACTPCGACRQLLAELAPASRLWMHERDETPKVTDPVTLLPDYFGRRTTSNIT